MPPEPRTQKTGTRTGEQTRAGVETRTGSKPSEAVKPSADNPPIKRADGTYRPLDTELMDRMLKSILENYERNPESHKHQAEFWQEHGLDRMSR